MSGSRFTGMLFGAARALSRTLVLLVLAFAPLICLRFCELRHAFARAASVECDVTMPADGDFIHDVQRLLTALTEFVPAAAALIITLVSHAQHAHAEPRCRIPQRRVPTPPPRLQCA